MTNAEIARRRGVSLDAVKAHVSSAVAKLGLADRRALRLWDGVPKRSRLARKEVDTAAGAITAVGQITRFFKDPEGRPLALMAQV